MVTLLTEVGRCAGRISIGAGIGLTDICVVFIIPPERILSVQQLSLPNKFAEMVTLLTEVGRCAGQISIGAGTGLTDICVVVTIPPRQVSESDHSTMCKSEVMEVSVM
jgi:hypothetical protein